MTTATTTHPTATGDEVWAMLRELIASDQRRAAEYEQERKRRAAEHEQERERRVAEHEQERERRAAEHEQERERERAILKEREVAAEREHALWKERQATAEREWKEREAERKAALEQEHALWKEREAVAERERKEREAVAERERKEREAAAEREQKESAEKYERERREREAAAEQERKEYAERYERERKDHAEKYAEFSADLKLTVKNLSKKIGEVDGKLGKLAESFISGGILKHFWDMGFTFTKTARNVVLKKDNRERLTEIDIFLENGEYALVVEVKLQLEIDDVKEHLERMELIRGYADARNDHRKYIGAVGGAMVNDSVAVFAMKQGLYVVTQSDDAISVAPTPANFKPREW